MVITKLHFLQVIFLDADQVIRTDIKALADLDLQVRLRLLASGLFRDL